MTDRGLARLRGVPVTVSYVADPAVGRGEFALDNEGDAPLSAAVVEAWLDRDGDRLPLPGVSLFDLGTEQAVESADLAVPARSTRRFLVGFPRVAVDGPVPAATTVGLRVRVGDLELEAASPIRLERRIPRR